MDRTTGRVRVRMVDIQSDRYMIARRYMLRLRRDDFDDPSELAKLGSVLGLTIEQFEEQFSYLVEGEPIPRPFFSDEAQTSEPPRVDSVAPRAR
jgi:ATP-dependent phosphofructokinase / diphosphate-dependent phosphofructokinase